jgi:hypothetical protein
VRSDRKYCQTESKKESFHIVVLIEPKVKSNRIPLQLRCKISASARRARAAGESVAEKSKIRKGIPTIT